MVRPPLDRRAGPGLECYFQKENIERLAFSFSAAADASTAVTVQASGSRSNKLLSPKTI